MKAERQTGLGILVACIAFLLFTLMDAILRGVGSTAPTVEKFVYLTLAASITVFLYGTKGCRDFKGLRTHHIKLHALRAVMYIVRFCVAIYTLPLISLANYFTLIFTGPLFVMILSTIFLKERADRHCWIAVIAGFIGVLIDMRPTGDFDKVSLLVLVAAFFNAVDVILMRFTNRKDSTAAASFYVQALSLIPAGLFMIWHYQPIPAADIEWVCLGGVLSGLALIALTAGYRMATTPVAAPFNYTQLVWGVAIGWVLWHDVPDLWTWVGGAIITASGLYILYRERSSGRIKQIMNVTPAEAGVQMD